MTALMLLTLRFTHAQDITFEAQVSSNPVSLGDQFQLSFVLSNAGMGGGKNLKLPNLGSFFLLSGPNQSSSMQFINGAVSSSITYTYVLQPKDVGDFTIGPATIEAGGKELSTESMTLQVVKGQTKQQSKNQPAQSTLPADLSENVFLRTVVDKRKVMQGEQISVAFKLYTRVSIQNYAIDKNPSLTGFWGEELENPKNISLTNETIDGKQYRVGVIRRYALFPTQSGKLEISPMEVQTVVQVQDRKMYDPFESFFRDPFGRTVNYALKSDPVVIEVQPLPGGAPLSFQGAVGRFSMTAKVDKQNPVTNEPVSLKISISGSGNIKLLESPSVEFPADFEQFTPKVSENISTKEELVSGSKTFEYLLIPRYPGARAIQPIVFSYYDLAKGEYVVLTSPQLDLDISPGAPVAGGSPFTASPREGVQMLSQDIRFIKVDNLALTRRGEMAYASPLFVVMALVPIIGFAGVLVIARQKESARKDVTGYRNRKALKVAKVGLQQAEHLLKQSDQTLEFYAEIARALWKYLGDKLNLSQAEMSVERVLDLAVSRGVQSELCSSLRSLLDSCEMARFAPTSHEAEEMRKTFAEARRIIVELEKAL
jgi:hypothetical protein